MMALITVLVLIFTRFYREILYIAFDEEFAKASGIPVTFLNHLLMILIALVVVLNIRAVGIVLMLSLLTVPQATANLLTKDFGKMMLFSVIFAFAGTFTGLVVSYFLNIPSGAAIIFTLLLIFGISKGIKRCI
jgi:zinc transport system permease protein